MLHDDFLARCCATDLLHHSTVRLLVEEIQRMRAELSRFSGCPSPTEWNNCTITVGGGEYDGRKVSDWITKVIGGDK
jgi:hypothetical protein